MLEHIFQDKDKWKKDTFNLIKKELISVKSNRFVRFDMANESHLVCVYGKSQVGKTTLILNMIGLKDEACRQNVSYVLRGGVARGNSSTSTAILYSKSDTNKYGVRIKSLGAQNESSEIKYCSAEEMIMKLQEIREAVENNVFNPNDILHIFIPNDYFSNTVEKESISILDLPGVESRNVQEKAHVESLMNRYIPLSSVCIIACPSNTIQSLEIEELPNNIDWKNLPHKFIVVLTKSYSAGSIKSYFNVSRTERKEGFKDFVKQRYGFELENILGTKNIKVFPVDIGDSLGTLVTELKNEEDGKEVIDTKDLILSDLHDFIIQHNGEQLSSAIASLRSIVRHHDEEKKLLLEQEKQEKSERRTYLDKQLSIRKIELDNIQGNIKEVDCSIQELKNKSQRINTDIRNRTKLYFEQLLERIKKTIDQNKLSKSKNNEIYFNDKNKNLMKLIMNDLYENLKIADIPKKCLINIDIYDSDLACSIYNRFRKCNEDLLYPPATGFFEKMFGSGCKVTLSTVFQHINSLEIIINDEVQTTVFGECNKQIEDKKKADQDYRSFLKKQESKLNNRINSIINEKSEIAERLKEIEDQEHVIQDLKDTDMQTLNAYLHYAEIAYKCQRDDIITQINSHITAEEKTIYVFLLGVLYKDFKELHDIANG